MNGRRLPAGRRPAPQPALRRRRRVPPGDQGNAPPVAPGAVAEPSWLALALAPSTVRRSVKVAAIVGTLLIAINHGDALLEGDVTLPRLLRMLLTVVVPYGVSTTASVAALRERAG